MPALTLVNKSDHYNTLLKSTAISSLKLDSVPKFKSHKIADEYLGELVATVNKQRGYSCHWETDLPVIVKDKDVELDDKKAEKKRTQEAKKKEEQVLSEVEDTVELIKTVIQAEELAGAKWYQTGAWIFSRKSMFGLEAKGNRKQAAVTLDKESGSVVPETGDHHKDVTPEGTPVQIKLRKGSGSVKWAAWKLTRRFTQNIADIFAAVEQSGWESVFPDGQLVSRPEVTELKKKDHNPEAPLDTFKRSLQMCEKKLEEIPKEDKATVKQLIADLNQQYSEWLK